MNDLDCPKWNPFLPTRINGLDEKHLFFMHGRTVDVLSSVTEETRPCVLLAGAAYMQPVFYTLYKNFDPEYPGRFDGATFVINERWSLLPARDILLLYLCLNFPEKTEGMEAREWLAAVWAISFCLALCPHHVRVLKKALVVLTKFSATPKAWALPENPLGRFVKFASADSFSAISQHWFQWKEGCGRNVCSLEQMRKEREACLEHVFMTPVSMFLPTESKAIVDNMVGIPFNTIADSRRSKMEADVVSFFEMGTPFAEASLNLPDSEGALQVNVTFFEKLPHGIMNSPFYALIPFQGFFQTFLYSPKECRSANIARSISEKLPVKDSKFKDHPLVANSVQQLALWLSAASRGLRQNAASKSSPDLTFVFDCSNLIGFFMAIQKEPETFRGCFGPPPQFDVVHTFNEMDNMSPPDLILRALPLLKHHGFLFSAVSNYRGYDNMMADTFLQHLFGPHPNICVAMYGLRCVGLDGRNTDSIHPRHMPWNFLRQSQKGDLSKSIMFQREISTPLKVTHLGDLSYAAKGLLNTTLTATKIFPGSTTSIFMCDETIITCLQAFIAQLDADCPVDNPYFWEPFVQLLREEKDFACFLHHIQVTALLHNIHFHLAVDETDCPVCRGLPLSSYVGQFAFTLPSISDLSALALIAYAHRGTMRLTEIRQRSDAHCINALVQRTPQDNCICLDFYFPKRFAEEDYDVTILSYSLSDIKAGKDINIPSLVCVGKLNPFLVGDLKYSFLPTAPRCSAPRTSFGRTVSHVAELEQCHTIIGLTPEFLDTFDMRRAPLETNSMDKQKLELKCCDHKIYLYYPYPVLFEQLNVEIRYKERMATVTIPRSEYSLFDEPPLCIGLPTSRLFYPASSFPTSVCRNYMGMQFTSSEREILKRNEYSVYDSHFTHLKEILELLFQQAAMSRYMHLCLRDCSYSYSFIQVLVVIHDLVRDPEIKSPALDMSYCFLQDHDQSYVTASWRKMTTGNRINSISINAADYGHLKNLFVYFSQRTHAVFSRNSRTNQGMVPVLGKHRMTKAFSRALVYPLYSDPDHEISGALYKSSKPLASAKRLLTPMEMKPILEKINPYLARDKFTALFGVVVDDPTDLTNALSKAALYANIIGNEKKEVSGKAAKEMGKVKGKKLNESKEDRKSESIKSNENEANTIVDKDSATNSKDSATESHKVATKSQGSATNSSDLATNGKALVTSGHGSATNSNDLAANGKKLVTSGQGSATSRQETSSSGEATAGSDAVVHSSKGRCAHCGKACRQMKKCAACSAVRYCSRECQKKHWKQHKPSCTVLTGEKQSSKNGKKMEGKDGEKIKKGSSKKKGGEEKEVEKEKEDVVSFQPKVANISKCSNCGKQSSRLKRCQCLTVAYCDSFCQRCDWPMHKVTCSAAPKSNK